MTLLAFTLLMMSSTPAPIVTAEAQQRQEAQATQRVPQHETPAQIEWFGHAIDRLLRGDISTDPTERPDGAASAPR